MAIHRYILLNIFLISLCLLSTHKSFAQNCNIIPEAIEKLYAPRLGTYSLWDLYLGNENVARSFHDYTMINEGSVIVAGLEENKIFKRPFIQKVNRKGRVSWTWQDKNKQGKSRRIEIFNLINEGKTFLAVGQKYRNDIPHSIWIGRFSKDGSKLLEQSISEASRDLTYAGLIKSINQKGWVLATTEQRNSKDQRLNHSYARFIKLNNEFQRVSKRSFIPGPKNHIHNIMKHSSPSGNYYIAAGEIDDGYGRPAGLLMRLDSNLNIVWQKSYPRGDGLRFKSLSKSGDNIVAIGTAQPIDPDMPNAGVAMKISVASGNVIWKRYFMRDDITYEAQDILETKDGRLHILLQGSKDKDEKIQEHARIITLSPRGENVANVSYTAGKGATPLKLKRTSNDLLTLSGYAMMEDPDPADPQNETILTQKAWFLVGEPFGLYKDACMEKERTF